MDAKKFSGPVEMIAANNPHRAMPATKGFSSSIIAGAADRPKGSDVPK